MSERPTTKSHPCFFIFRFDVFPGFPPKTTQTSDVNQYVCGCVDVILLFSCIPFEIIEQGNISKTSSMHIVDKRT